MRQVLRRSARSGLFILCVLFTVFLLVFWPAVAFGQQPPVLTLPPGDDTIAVVRKGDPAPFTGQLFSPDTAIRWANWLEQYRVRLKLDVELERRLCETETAYRDRVLEAEKVHAREVKALYTAELDASRLRVQQLEKELEDPPWYRTPGFGAALGVGATLGAVILGVVIVDAGSGG